LGLGLGGLYALVLDDLLAQVHEQRPAMGAVTAELVLRLLVSHEITRLGYRAALILGQTIGAGATSRAKARRAAVAPHQSWRRLKPRACSVSITSSIDFLPKFGIAFSSASDLEIRSPTVWMPARFRQLYERTPSSSSSIRIPSSSPWGEPGPPTPPGPTARPWPSSWPPGVARSSWMRSASVKIASWLISSSAASRSAACGSIEP